jgi:hypothetical protein
MWAIYRGERALLVYKKAFERSRVHSWVELNDERRVLILCRFNGGVVHLLSRSVPCYFRIVNSKSPHQKLKSKKLPHLHTHPPLDIPSLHRQNNASYGNYSRYNKKYTANGGLWTSPDHATCKIKTSLCSQKIHKGSIVDGNRNKNNGRTIHKKWKVARKKLAQISIKEQYYIYVILSICT